MKTVLITGASSGIGKAIAQRLIKDGLKVYAAARRTTLMKDLEANGATIMEMDITKNEDVINVVNTIIEKEGRIDVLVNNAGFAIYGSVEETTIEEARRQFDVNIFGLANLTQKIIPHMRNQNSGKIINMSSVGGKIYTPLGAWYHATKHALEGWSDCLRIELQPFGIDVVIVEPGGIATEFGEVMMRSLVEHEKDGPYADLAKKVVRSTEDIYAGPNPKGSPPVVIAEVVSKAVQSKKPKTRYVKGYMGKTVTLLRRLLNDRMFDKMIFSQLK